MEWDFFKGRQIRYLLQSQISFFRQFAEEMGLIFALGLILVCVSVYMMFLNIAMQLRDSFYKLVALGLGTCYIFQYIF